MEIEKDKLLALREAIYDIWNCCEENCPKYYQCNRIANLDDISKEIFD